MSSFSQLVLLLKSAAGSTRSPRKSCRRVDDQTLLYWIKYYRQHPDPRRSCLFAVWCELFVTRWPSSKPATVTCLSPSAAGNAKQIRNGNDRDTIHQICGTTVRINSQRSHTTYVNNRCFLLLKHLYFLLHNQSWWLIILVLASFSSASGGLIRKSGAVVAASNQAGWPNIAQNPRRRYISPSYRSTSAAGESHLALVHLLTRCAR